MIVDIGGVWMILSFIALGGFALAVGIWRSHRRAIAKIS